MREKKFYKEGIMNILKKNRKMLKGYGVDRIGLFGSCLREKRREKSDIDLLVEFNKATFDNYMGLRSDLEQRLHRKIDLVSIKALKEKIKEYILKEVEWA